MTWLVPVVFACFAAAVFLWTRGLRIAAALVGLVGVGLLFFVGRGIEVERDTGWKEAAARLHGTFRSRPACADLDRFGTPAPWAEWANDGELQCLRLIEGETAGGPWALVQVRYSVRQRRGEEQPDAWYEVTAAVMRRAAAGAARNLAPLPSAEAYTAVHNGPSVYVWKKGPLGAGASLRAEELPALLEEARRIAR